MTILYLNDGTRQPIPDPDAFERLLNETLGSDAAEYFAETIQALKDQIEDLKFGLAECDECDELRDDLEDAKGELKTTRDELTSAKDKLKKLEVGDSYQT